MQFQNAIITNEGVRIFQAALANNPVVFTKCLFSGSSTPLTGSMTALPEPTWGNGHVTNYAANDNGGDFIIYASATNATDYGYAYGYGIYGYLQNEGIENETLLVVANYDGNVTYVSEASGPYTRFHFAITIKLSMAAGVLSVAPHYNDLVSDAAFQNLANRTVTTHTAVDPNAGDDQTVRGHKEFTDGIGVWDSNNGWGLEITNYENNEGKNAVLLRTTNGAYYGSTIELVPKTNENQSYTKNDIKFNANLIPYDDGLSLGVSEHRWLELNANYVWASDTIGVSNQYGSTGMRAEGVEFLNAEGDSVGTIGVHDDTQFLIEGNGSPVHIASLTVDDNATITNDLSVNGVISTATINLGGARLTGNAYYIATDKSLNVTGDATVSGQVMVGSRATIGVLGTSPYYIGTYQGELRVGNTLNDGAINGGSFRASTISANTLNVDTITNAHEINALNLNAGSVRLGVESISFNPGFSFPYPDGQNAGQMPLGSIFLGYIEAAQNTLQPGDIVPNNGVTLLYIPAIDTSGNIDFAHLQQLPLNSAQYRVMNIVTSAGGLALVMRVG